MTTPASGDRTHECNIGHTRRGRIGLRVLVVLLVIFSALNFNLKLDMLRPYIGLAEARTDLGLSFAEAETRPYPWRQITVEPGSAAEEAGLRSGDIVRRARPLGYKMIDYAGDSFDYDVIRDGRQSRVTVIWTAGDGYAADVLISIAAAMILMMVAYVFSLLILWKRWGQPVAMCLGLLMFAAATTSGFVPRWSPSPLADIVILEFSLIHDLVGGLVPALFYFLCGDAGTRRQARICAIWFAVAAIAKIVSSQQYIWQYDLPPPLLLSTSVSTIVGVLSWIIGLGIVIANYRRLGPAQRNRIKVIMAAFGLLVFGGLLGSLSFLKVLPEAWTLTLFFFLLGLSTVAISLVAYAVLGQNLFDFGFAVNRTLVYGAVTFTVLISFGLMEWGVNEVVPAHWRAGGSIISAGIALMLYLLFNRIHGFIERGIETLFFSSWRRAEGALDRFVESGGHFDRVESLCAAIIDALHRYAGGASAALYVHEGNGAYALCAGAIEGGGQAITQEDPVFALMRAERRPVELAGLDTAIPGALILPMLDQGTLAGFALLGAKPDGMQYRPDELENLGRAVHQLGLDLRALRARQLHEQNGRLSAQLERMTRERDTLKEILTGSAPARTG